MSLPTFSQITQKARELGFHHVALLTMPEVDEAGEKLKNWLKRGFHSDMDWMLNHLDKRLDPLSLMPGTRSVLCVTMNYYPGDIPEDAPAKVARYAQGDDYHKLIRKRLKALLTWLQGYDSTIQGRPLTDSAPVMERALAVKAGIGWIGKNANLITRDRGSWVFLAELLLNVTFDDAPDPEPIWDLCGRCRRCIDACPTEAIVEPRTVDANRCISYWTIEHRGDHIEETIANHLEGWLFGCDICQEVCPWNIRFQQPSPVEPLRPRPWNKSPQLEEIAEMTPEQFQVRYRNSPIKRTGLEGLKRNAKALLNHLKCRN